MSKNITINERSSHLMKILVEKYIHDGQPIGSKLLQQSSGLKLSAATIRNVMSDLEKCGLLHSPHTSAGRVPTTEGYRLFVDKLLSVQPIAGEIVKKLRHDISEQSHQTLLQTATDTLSDITRMASVVVTPPRDLLTLKHIEFLPLSEGRILVVIVKSDDEIQNRIIQVKKNFSSENLHHMANYLNATFSGKNLNEVRQNLVAEMEQTRQDMDEMMRQAIELAQDTFVNHEDEKNDLVVSGETNLMLYSEMDNMNKMHRIFQAFHEKKQMVEILNHINQAQGVQIFIGRESGYKPLEACSVIAAPYQVDENTMGVLGVVGPTRMEYNKIIPIVDITAKLLTTALNREI